MDRIQASQYNMKTNKRDVKPANISNDNLIKYKQGKKVPTPPSQNLEYQGRKGRGSHLITTIAPDPTSPMGTDSAPTSPEHLATTHPTVLASDSTGWLHQLPLNSGLRVTTEHGWENSSADGPHSQHHERVTLPMMLHPLPSSEATTWEVLRGPLTPASTHTPNPPRQSLGD